MAEDDQASTSIDIGNLACFNTADIEDDGTNFEEILRKEAEGDAQLLIKTVFSLPRDAQVAGIPGIVVSLPAPTTHLPREKPLPKAKAPTKWEKFAKEKGIQKRKKSRMVFDEDKEQYMPRYGYKKANDESTAWAIPAKKGEDPSEDPWTRMDREKKERMAKNKKQQLNNIKSSLKENQVKDRMPGALDLATAAEALSGPQGRKTAKKEKKHVDKALELAQKSTASMGRFDHVKADEPAPKMAKAPTNREAQISVAAERKQSLAVLDKIMGTGGNSVGEDERAARVVHKELMQEGVGNGDKKGYGKRRRAGADGIGEAYVMDTGGVTGSRKSSKKAQKKAGDYGGKHGQGKGKKGNTKKHKKG